MSLSTTTGAVSVEPDDGPVESASTDARSRERWSGATTTKPHWARCVVRKLDCSGYEAYPWLNSTTGKDRSGSPLGPVSLAMGTFWYESVCTASGIPASTGEIGRASC